MPRVILLDILYGHRPAWKTGSFCCLYSQWEVFILMCLHLVKGFHYNSSRIHFLILIIPLSGLYICDNIKVVVNGPPVSGHLIYTYLLIYTTDIIFGTMANYDIYYITSNYITDHKVLYCILLITIQ